MSDGNRIARLRISGELIAQAFAMPEGAKIIQSVNSTEMFSGVVEVIVTSPDLPEIAEGELIPLVNPTITLIDADARPDKFFEFDWNLD